MIDFEGPAMPRSNISDARTPKRRRLNDNSFEEVLPHPHTLSRTALIQHEYEYADPAVRAEGEPRVDCSAVCESNVETTAVNIRDDGWSECCYGMVGDCIHLYILILLISSSSYLAFECDSDLIQKP